MTLRRRLSRGRKDWAMGSVCLLIAMTSLIIFLQTLRTTKFIGTLSLGNKAEWIQAVNVLVPRQNSKSKLSGLSMATVILNDSDIIKGRVSVYTTRKLTDTSTGKSKDVKNFIIPKYTVGSNTRCDNNTDILVYFQSLWSNFMKRRTLRSTWASHMAYKHLGKLVKFVFIIGRPSEVNDQVKINNEQLLHGDIIEGDFIDSFRNITLKSIIAMAFIEHNCEHVKYVIKVDDDIFLNLFAVIKNVLPLMSQEKDVISCHVIESGKSPIVRDKNSKWYIPLEVFKNRTHLPRFCSGYTVIMTFKLVTDLFHKAKITPLINVDDVYMFGQLTLDNPEIKFIDIKGNLTLFQDKGLNSYRKGKSDLLAVDVRDSSAMEELWSLTLMHYGH